MKKTNLLAILFAVFSLCALTVGCDETDTDPDDPNQEENNDDPDDPDDPDTPDPDGVVRNMTLDLGVKYQTIEGFAASDCWSGNYVGEYWGDTEKEQIAEWLFSQEVNSTTGSPKGIGLSMWRFNLGAGTAQQSNSGFSNIENNADSFLNDDGSYDWTRHVGQRYFLDKAKQMGVESFVMFSNSPPVQMTKNGLGYSSGGTNTNLADDCYDDFAEYIGEVLSHMKTIGFDFSYISPVNEPQYSWSSAAQEGTPWQNAEVAALCREIDNSITSRGLSTQIMIGEAGQYSYQYGKTVASRGLCIEDYFNPTSDNYVGDLQSMASLIAGHGYWEDGNWNELKSGRTSYWEAANARGLRTYQTEWSMLGDGYDDANFVDYADCDYLDIAMYMSQVIHHDMVNANCSSWSYWTSMAQERWSHKNRFLLITIEPGGSAYGTVTTPGNVYDRKNLWVLGNYSRFIRPGYQRVELAMEEETTTFFGSAYVSPEGNQIVAVFTNFTDKLVNPTFTFENLDREIESVERYVTNSASDLRLKTDYDGLFRVEANSVTTIVINLK